jgi:hypothetical protein
MNLSSWAVAPTASWPSITIALHAADSDARIVLQFKVIH